MDNSTIMPNNSTIRESLSADFELTAVGDFAERRDVRRHAHNYAELVYILDGQCVSENGDGSKLVAEAGMAYLFPPYTEHDQRGLCETIYIGFAVPKEALPGKMLLLDLRRDPLPRRWLKDIIQLYCDHRYREVETLALTVYLHIREGMNRRQITADMPGEALIANSLIFIDNHYRRNLTAGEIARYVHCSVSTLNNCYKRRFGKSVMRYVCDFKLDIGRQLLSNDYLSIGEIAERSGFASLNYFVRAFRKRYGATPGAMRLREKQHIAAMLRPES